MVLDVMFDIPAMSYCIFTEKEFVKSEVPFQISSDYFVIWKEPYFVLQIFRRPATG